MGDTDSQPDIRDTLAAAFDEAEKATEASAPAVLADKAVPGGEPESADAQDAHARDEKGRFASKPPEAKQKAAVERKPETEVKAPLSPASVSGTAAPQVAASNVTTVKAPQSWTPAEREEFGKLPRVAQEAVLRRETEFQKSIQESAEHRNGYQQFQKVIAPYEGLIRSRGGEPVQVVDAAVRAYVGLHTSPPHVQAQMIANMVRGLNVPIDVLDSVLAGETSQTQAPQPQFDESAIEQRLLARLESQRVAQEVASWSQGKEFFDDVSSTMEGLLLAAAKSKRPMSLDQAYEQACRADPQISGVLEGRKAEETKKTKEAELAQKRVAATSVRSSPAGRMNGASSPKSVVDYVQQAWNTQEGV